MQVEAVEPVEPVAPPEVMVLAATVEGDGRHSSGKFSSDTSMPGFSANPVYLLCQPFFEVDLRAASIFTTSSKCYLEEFLP